ncbi:XRE family transcriptional regulator [Pseudomonas protegens]|uniref:helix-turn-helix domain-containing protein n=1 Tax=Pseudomonas protegens TaxID=380021 RepID=UPI002937317F|nr:XRE family transcriptional regulator [Pseudomonas protegens]WOE81651.1 XRE family transcriptional regulator [Pseudomonas protegens]
MNDISDFNPARLVLARQRRGWTKKSLADATLLSSKTISLYESGDQLPTEESLSCIAQALGFPIPFFSGRDPEAPTEENASFRSFSRMTAGQRDAALAAGGIAYMLSDWIDSKYHLPAPLVPDCSGMDPEAAAEAVRVEWGLGQLPIKNLVHLLELKGVRVFSLAEETNQVNAFSCWRKGTTPFVFLNTQKSAEASRFDAAHELGHLVLHRHGSNKGKEVESEANAFASAFLMPYQSILAHGWSINSVKDVIRAKKIWNVSAMALAYRLHKTGMLSEWVYRSMCIELSTMGARTQEPEPSQRETSQVLQKVLGLARDTGRSLTAIAKELDVSVDDLIPILFSMAPVAISGDYRASPVSVPKRKPNLRLVKA